MNCLRVLPLAIVLISPLSGLAQKKIHVIDRDDQKTGVESEMFIIDQKKSETRLGATDQNGIFLLSKTCAQGQRIEAIPKSKNYHSNMMECPPAKEQLPVQKLRYALILKANAEFFEAIGDHAKAALIYNEVANRAETFDPDLAVNSKEKVYILFGKSLGNENPIKYDTLQNKKVISQEFKEEIVAFQRKNGVRATGMIDYKTLSKAAGTSISPYIYDRFY